MLEVTRIQTEVVTNYCGDSPLTIFFIMLTTSLLVASALFRGQVSASGDHDHDHDHDSHGHDHAADSDVDTYKVSKK